MTDVIGYGATFLLVVLIVLLLNMLGEATKPEPTSFKWGDKPRRPPPDIEWWGQHWFLALMTVMLGTLFLRVVLPAVMAN